MAWNTSHTLAFSTHALCSVSPASALGLSCFVTASAAGCARRCTDSTAYVSRTQLKPRSEICAPRGVSRRAVSSGLAKLLVCAF